MCGGFIAAASARDAVRAARSVPLLPAATIARRQLGYHLGRVTTYAALGATFGLAGSAALDSALLLPLQRALYVGANLFLLGLGLSVARGSRGSGRLQRAGAGLFALVLPALRPVLARTDFPGRVALGFAWGLVPCALVYAVLPLALFAGGAWQGAAVMLAFGAGTVPTLVAARVAVRLPTNAVDLRSWRYLAAFAVIAFSLIGIYRGLFVAGALAQGPFCLVD
jgi:sulfite exporter TauE/SafE